MRSITFLRRPRARKLDPMSRVLSAIIFQYFLLIVGSRLAWDESLIADAEAFCFHHDSRL
jgi:hypothetical protein